MVWIKNLIVLIKGVRVGGFYKTTHRSNAEYANKQCWLQQETRSLYILCCEWEWLRDLKGQGRGGPQHLFPIWILRDCWITCGRPKSEGTVRRPKSTGLLTLITNNYMGRIPAEVTGKTNNLLIINLLLLLKNIISLD